MKKLIFVAILLALTPFARADVSKPDFAYPRQVIADAEQQLIATQKSGDGIGTLQAFMEIAVAKNSVNRDSTQYVAERLLSAAKKQRNTQVKSLMDLYAATLINNIYSQRKYVYDNRKLPDTPRPADMAEWSGRMFNAVIDSLCNESWNNVGNMSISDLTRVVEADDLCQRYYPTQADFVATQILDKFSLSDDALVDRINQEMISRHSRYSAGWCNWQVRAMKSGIDRMKVMEFYFGVPEEYRSNALLVFPCLADKSVSTSMSDEDKLSYLADLNKALLDAKGTWAEQAVQLLIDREMQPTLDFEIPGLMIADKPTTFSLKNICNVKTFTIKATDGNEHTITKAYDINHESPVAADTTLVIQLPQGNYMLKAYVSDENYSTATVKVVKALPQAIYNTGFAAVHVVDAETGESLPNVTASVISNKKVVATAVSGKDGIAKFAANVSGYVRLTINGLSQDFSSVRLGKITEWNEDNIAYSITTDRPLYLPGDTVRWVGLASQNGNVVANRTMKVTMQGTDASKSVVECTTDEYGRVSGEFVIADDVKAGTFRIYCDKDSGIQASFAVNDFRVQNMQITDLVVWPRKDMADAVTVTGNVVNYSGFGIDNASVECAVGESSVQGTTNTDGAFEITVPYTDEVIAERSVERLTVNVVATDGSSISQTTSFNSAYPYKLSLSDVQSVYDTSKAVTFSAKMVNPVGDVIKTPMHWQLNDAQRNTVKTGAIVESGEQSLDLSDIKAGTYSLVLAADSVKYAQEVKKSIILYNSTGKDIPGNQCLWLRNTEPLKAINPDNTITLTIGVRYDNTIVYTYVESDSPKYDIHKFDAGYHTLTVNLADVKSPGNTLRITAVRNAEIKSYEIEVPETIDQKLNIVTESFRDKIYASEKENWHISFTDKTGKKVKTAMALTMFDRRLNDMFQGNKSSLYIEHYKSKRDLYYSELYAGKYDLNVCKRLNARDYTSLSSPQWLYSLTNTYGLTGRRYIRGSKTRYYATSTDDAVVETVAAVEMKAESANASAEVSAFDSNLEDSGVDESEDDEYDSFDDIELRNTSDFVALWQPNLVSDAQGDYDINFMVPNVNTTWKLQGYAWTKDGKCVDIDKEFVAAKPIMVSVNTPRFLRGDDRAQVAITVMNNSDAVQQVNIAAFVDADSLAVGAISKQTFAKTLQPGESDIVTITLDATQSALINAGSAIVTAKVTNGTFSDGERVNVPVLPSQTLVVNSTNFYLNPGDGGYQFDVPDSAGSNYSCSLTFTENPMWTIVESLPKLVDETNINSSATSQASAYFSAAVALGLMKQHPELELQFSTSQLQKLMAKTQQNLISLQQSNGSWSWGCWCTSGDFYATQSILSLFAVLSRSGYLPTDSKLVSMINRAVKYYDGAVKDTDMLYTINRSAFPDVAQSLNGKQVSNATVQSIIKNWKKYDVLQKAQAAIALHYTDNEKMAKTLMGSLDEFGTQTSTKGFEFMNVRNLPAYAWLLQAYSAITPTSNHVDGIRQYLIVRKQATDWGNYPTTSQIVSAMINSGTKWTESAEGATVTVDGTPLDLKAQGRMGTLTTELTGRHVSIATNGKTPSYGAFIAKYNAPMTEVESYSDGEISINKTMYVQRSGKWQNIDSLRVGDRVKIVLTVKASRPFSQLVITDDRAATFMPKDQLAGWVYGDGISAYRENRNSQTNLYINYMSKGTYLLEYEMTVNNAGQFALGIATVTCSLAPELTAHSGGSLITVSPR